jgi:UDP-2,3-diacylglucosamine pyrophosphatase LpxH
MDEVVWIVSDVHLGSANSNHLAFADFLAAVKEGRGQFILDGSSIPPPSKLVLLGDILELWDPIDDDHKNAALHLFEAMNALLYVSREIVFVTGNHDEAMETFEALYPMKNPSFQIIARHYPDSEPRYIQVGPYRYFFLHGHQFDKLFLWLDGFSKIPSFMAESNHLITRFTPFDGWALPILFVFFSALRFFLSWPAVGIIYVTFAFSIPRLFTYLQGPFWKAFGRYLTNRPKHKDIEEVVKNRYYDKNKDTISADVIVYGHTHVPEVSPPHISEKLGKTLINTGSWVQDQSAVVNNTIVVIDSKGARLLAWEGREKGFKMLGGFP